MRVKVTNSVGLKWVGFAKKKLAQMETQRARLSLPFQKKVIYMGDVYVMIFTSPRDKWIYIFGGAEGHILLGNYDSGSVDTKVYDYLADALGDAVLVNGVSEDTLHPNFNGRSHYGEQVSINIDNTWGTSTLDDSLTHIALSHKWEFELLNNENDLYARVGDSLLYVNQRPTPLNFLWDDENAREQDDFIYMPRNHTAMWNLINGPEWWVYSPNTNSLFPSAWWVPNILCAEAGNGLLTTGFYYGQLGGGWVGKDDPSPETPGNAALECAVTFNGLMDGRKSGALLPYGYAETLVRLDDQYFNTIYFYLSGSPMPEYGNPSVLYQGLLYNRDVGTEMHGKPWTFLYEPSFTLAPGEDYTVSFWNCPDDRPEILLGYEQDYVGCVVSRGQDADVFLWTGVTYDLLTTDNYHSHSYSTDGTLLAVFEGTSIIEKVHVFDLKKRESVRVSTIVAEVGAQTGCVIPYRPDNFSPQTLDYLNSPDFEATETVDDPELLKFVAPFGHAIYNSLLPKGFIWRKVVCADGVHAIASHTDDPCMEGNFTLIRADLNPPGGTYTITVDGVSYTGAWSEISTQLPYTLFSSVEPPQIALCTWVEKDGGYIAVPVDATVDRGSVSQVQVPTFIVYYDTGTGEYLGSGYLGGDYTITENPDPEEYCGDYTYDAATGTDACGREAMYEVYVPPIAATPSIGGDFTDIGIGTVWTATGGTPPYSNWNFPGGSVSVTGVNNQTATVTSIPSCTTPGDPAYFDVTVQDDCGKTASLSVSVASIGSWCCVNADGFNTAGACSGCATATYCCIGINCCGGFLVFNVITGGDGACGQPSGNPYTVYYTGDVGGFAYQEIFYAFSGLNFPTCCEQHYGWYDGYNADPWAISNYGASGACCTNVIRMEYICT